MLKTSILFAVALIALVLGHDEADAQEKKTYVVTFESVSSNCKDGGMKLSKAGVTVTPSGKSISLAIPGIPALKGTARKGGKFKARTKKAATDKPNVTGRYSAGGRVSASGIRFLLIAEYFSGGKPLCTQSWNAGS